MSCGQRFRPLFRLRKTDEFSSVFSFRRVIRRGALQLFFRPNNLSTARLGVVVGKKFLASAVARNRVKRVVREVFRISRSSLPAVDIVVRVAAKPGPENIWGDMERLLDRLRKESQS